MSFTGFTGTAPTDYEDNSGFNSGFDGNQFTVSIQWHINVGESFSFTSATITYDLFGVGSGANFTVNTDNGPFMAVHDQHYTGSAPPDQSVLLSASPVPEPSSVVLLGLGLAGLITLRRKFQPA